MMDIEVAAKAAFDAFHVRFNRVRSWASHPDHDGVEPGRETYREMMRAVDVIASAHPLDVLAANTPEGASAAHEAVFGTPLPADAPQVEHLV